MTVDPTDPTRWARNGERWRLLQPTRHVDWGLNGWKPEPLPAGTIVTVVDHMQPKLDWFVVLVTDDAGTRHQLGLGFVAQAELLTEESPMTTHPAACPYCGSHAVNQVQPDVQLRHARLNDDGTITVGDVVDGVDFRDGATLFCNDCSSEFVQPADMTELFDPTLKVEYPRSTPKDDPKYVGHEVKWFPVTQVTPFDGPPEEGQQAALVRALREAARPLIHFRDQHADIHGYPDDFTGSDRLREVAQALDTMFDAYDSALRSLEEEEPCDDENRPVETVKTGENL